MTYWNPQLVNGKWVCRQPPKDPSENTIPRGDPAQKALLKQLKQVFSNHDDYYLPEGGEGKMMMLQSTLDRLNIHRQLKGWSQLSLVEALSKGA